MKRLWDEIKKNIAVELFYLAIRIHPEETMKLIHLCTIAHEIGIEHRKSSDMTASDRGD
jgi:hypothetical protein